MLVQTKKYRCGAWCHKKHREQTRDRYDVRIRYCKLHRCKQKKVMGTITVTIGGSWASCQVYVVRQNLMTLTYFDAYMSVNLTYHITSRLKSLNDMTILAPSLHLTYRLLCQSKHCRSRWCFQCARFQLENKPLSIEDRDQTDRINTRTYSNFNSDLDLRPWLQSLASYSYVPYTCKKSRSKVSWL